jgi:predicted nucleotidyltransferase
MDNQKYIEIITEKLKSINPYLIILFGSYAYGTPHEDSDIDILVVTQDDFMPKTFSEKIQYRIKIRKIIYEQSEQVPIDLLVFTRPMFDKFKELDSSFSKEILTNGKKLYESNNARMD